MQPIISQTALTTRFSGSLTWGPAPAYLEGGKNTFWHKEQAHLTCFPLRLPLFLKTLYTSRLTMRTDCCLPLYIMPVFTPSQLKLFNTEMAKCGLRREEKKEAWETKNLDNLHQIDPSSFLSLHLFICLSFSNLQCVPSKRIAAEIVEAIKKKSYPMVQDFSSP